MILKELNNEKLHELARSSGKPVVVRSRTMYFPDGSREQVSVELSLTQSIRLQMGLGAAAGYEGAVSRALQDFQKRQEADTSNSR